MKNFIMMIEDLIDDMVEHYIRTIIISTLVGFLVIGIVMSEVLNRSDTPITIMAVIGGLSIGGLVTWLIIREKRNTKILLAEMAAEAEAKRKEAEEKARMEAAAEEARLKEQQKKDDAKWALIADEVNSSPIYKTLLKEMAEVIKRDLSRLTITDVHYTIYPFNTAFSLRCHLTPPLENLYEYNLLDRGLKLSKEEADNIAFGLYMNLPYLVFASNHYFKSRYCSKNSDDTISWIKFVFDRYNY